MKTTDTTDLTPFVATLAAKGTRDMMGQLAACGLPLDAILSGILGEAIRTFAADQGWDEAALLCDEMARQARTMGKPGAAELARVEAAGRA